MDIEKDYVEYVAEFSLALLAGSAAYFFDPGVPASYATLLLVPVLFGYTAYISRESFSMSSFLALIALMFAPLNSTLAALTVFIALGNVLVSLFSGGERFRDFYSSTALPLLLTGAAIGTGLFFMASSNPAVADDIRNRAGNFLGESVESAAEDAELFDQQKEAQKMIIRQASISTVKATEGYILNETRGQLPYEDEQAIISAFNGAEEEVPDLIVSKAEQRMNRSSVDFSRTTKNLVTSNLKGKALVLLIPVTTLMLYSLQPLIGFLTALSATLFSLMMTRED
ncbi:MAG: hypothetical protein ABEJ91_01975 [Candidatus Nanohaloarchaea archaeon]